MFYTTDATQPHRKWVVDTVVGDETSTTVHGLSVRTTYYFKLQAQNAAGDGPLCPNVIFRTPGRKYAGYIHTCLTALCRGLIIIVGNGRMVFLVSPGRLESH